MSLRPQPLPPVPEATAAAVHAAFPKGNLYVANMAMTPLTLVGNSADSRGPMVSRTVQPPQ
jgi:hypothetical protein